jgi:nicotinamidase-related amidase
MNAQGENAMPGLLVGKAALLVVDIQGSSLRVPDQVRDFPMPGYDKYMRRVPPLIEVARAGGIPIIYIQEVHHPSMVDFGRELDGYERVHCLENDPGTDVAVEVGKRPDDYWIRKRRYSSFFCTDLEILLRGLEVRTLLLVGGFTDVCIHYTFADAHQRNYVCRVVEDCVAGSSQRAHKAALAAMDRLQPGCNCRRSAVMDALRSRAAAAS